jgi:hypothetical protein
MRIALLLQGHFRSFENTHQSWINALEDCEYDCYFTTWNIIDANTKSWHSDANENQPELTSSQINLLKSYDPNVTINSQEFTKEEKNDIYASSPYKTHIYKFEVLKNTLQRIESLKEEKEYDMIICGRFDIEIKSIKFKDINMINKDEIIFGGRIDSEKDKYLHNLSATDLIYIFHPSRKEIFYNLPIGLINRRFFYAEDYMTELFFSNFIKVIHAYTYGKDFNIIRLHKTNSIITSFTINYNLLRGKR